MSEVFIENLKEFLNDANLSTYEINAYIVLIKASKVNPLSARQISSQSGVPSGRIYEVLEELNTKGLIEIIESRPKKFKAFSMNKGLDNLIKYQSIESKRKTDYLHTKAKILETELYNSETALHKEPSKIFWSVSYGTQSILSMYVKYINEAKEEIIFNEFINESTIKILPFGKIVYEPLYNAVKRGVKVRDLWSFEYDKRTLSQEEKIQNIEIFKKICEIQEDLYNLSPRLTGFQMKYIFQRTTTYFDIFDKRRVVFKLQNPLKPYQIFASMNVIDPNLAEDLRTKFLQMWRFEAFEI
ncbi:MAG: TrmB family transcriptional regulator [Candidatus Hermodarchaeota archaeon]